MPAPTRASAGSSWQRGPSPSTAARRRSSAASSADGIRHDAAVTSGYFGTDGVEPAPAAQGSSHTQADLPHVDVGSGVSMRVLAGERLLLSYVTIEPHGVAPVHVHTEEQLGVVVSGSC